MANKITGAREMVNLLTGETVSFVTVTGDVSKYVFSFALAVDICQEIRSGRSLVDVCRDARFPPLHVILLWRRQHPMFAEHIKLAKRDRVEYHIHNLERLTGELAEGGLSKPDVDSYRAASDNYKWLAEKENREEYGVKEKEDTGVSIVINTGTNASA